MRRSQGQVDEAAQALSTSLSGMLGSQRQRKRWAPKRESKTSMRKTKPSASSSASDARILVDHKPYMTLAGPALLAMQMEELRVFPFRSGASTSCGNVATTRGGKPLAEIKRMSQTKLQKHINQQPSDHDQMLVTTITRTPPSTPRHKLASSFLNFD